MRSHPTLFGLTIALLGAAAAGPAVADPVHLRGTVATVDGSHVSIATNDGKTVGLTLGDDVKLGGVVPASLADIKPGGFIGTANMEGPDGNKALEVVVFPEALRGTGEGNYGWDLKPKSSMTNATVAEKVDSVSGPTMTLKYKGGEKKVSIPPGTPIVSLAPATATDVKPGAKVFAAGELSADGATLTTGRLVVGENGATPPM